MIKGTQLLSIQHSFKSILLFLSVIYLDMDFASQNFNSKTSYFTLPLLFDKLYSIHCIKQFSGYVSKLTQKLSIVQSLQPTL